MSSSISNELWHSFHWNLLTAWRQTLTLLLTQLEQRPPENMFKSQWGSFQEANPIKRPNRWAQTKVRYKKKSSVGASIIFFDVLRNLDDRSERKILFDLEVSGARNLLIRSKIRYLCSTDRSLRVLLNDFELGQVSVGFRIQASTQCFLLFEKGFFLHSHKVVLHAFFLDVDFLTNYLVMENFLQ